ncbi:MAG TPA: hypothetical protein VGF60_13655 [Xanthobacteraceae bacterium]|jgi:hypothetical protein
MRSTGSLTAVGGSLAIIEQLASPEAGTGADGPWKIEIALTDPLDGQAPACDGRAGGLSERKCEARRRVDRVGPPGDF